MGIEDLEVVREEQNLQETMAGRYLDAFLHVGVIRLQRGPASFNPVPQQPLLDYGPCRTCHYKKICCQKAVALNSLVALKASDCRLWNLCFVLPHNLDRRDAELIRFVEWEDNQLEGGQRPPYCDIQAGMTLDIMAVRSSKPVPADAKLTPVFTSSFDSLGSKNGGTNSFIPNLEATISGMSLPSLNLPIAT